jgi:hypothetical protein
MKILISESQLRKVILSEQGSDPFVPKNVLGIPQYGEYERMYDSDAVDHTDEDSIMRMITELGISAIPGIGQYMSILYGGSYAKEEFNKGNNKMGTFIAVLTALPMFKQIRTAIPVLKELGVEGMNVISKKILKGIKLTTIESNVVNLLEKNKFLIEKELSELSKRLSVLENIKPLKNNYIYKFGLQKYEDLLRKYVSKNISKEQFIGELNFAKGDTYKLAKWAVNAGIKFEEFEMDQMTKILPDIQKGVEVARRIFLEVNGELKSILVIIKKFPNASFGGKMIDGDKILMNLEKLNGKSIDEIGEILSHEAAHVKDPSLISHVYRDTYNATRKLVDVADKKFNDLATAAEKTGQGISDAVKAGEEFTKAFTKYVFHPQEIIANNQMVLNNMTKKITDVVSNVGANGAKQTLNNVINFVSGKDLLDDAAKQLLGKKGIEHLNGLYNYSKSEYQELLKKIAKQSDYLKSQLNLLVQ